LRDDGERERVRSAFGESGIRQGGGERERERENTINEERGKRVLRIFCGIVA
jgi:hypothetical protein